MKKCLILVAAILMLACSACGGGESVSVNKYQALIDNLPQYAAMGGAIVRGNPQTPMKAIIIEATDYPDLPADNYTFGEYTQWLVPEECRATTPEELNTLIKLRSSFTYTHDYTDGGKGFSRHDAIEVIDVASGNIIATKDIPSSPPFVKESTREGSDAYAERADLSIESFIEDLLTPVPAPEILSYSSYAVGTTYHVVGEVKNAGAKLCLVYITATFYDSAGTVVGEETSHARIRTLLPNQKAAFEIIVLDAAISAQVDHCALAVSDYTTATEDPYRAFTILSHTPSIDASGYYHVVGEVKNTGTQAVVFIEVVATFYDATGKVVGFAWDFTDPNELTAGQTAHFDVYALDSTWSAKVSSYELQVQADLSS